MTTTSNSILLLCTEKSRQQPNTGFDEILEKLENDNDFSLEVCENYEAAAKLLESEDREFNVVLVHFHSADPRDLWRRVYYRTRAYNKYTEVIVIVVDNDEENKIEAREVLSSGCFAFFQYQFAPEVLFGYIEAARLICENRRIRANLSRELNEGFTVKVVATKIAHQLEKLTKCNNITITLLKKGRPEQGYLRKLIYPSLERNHSIDIMRQWFLKPTNEDGLIRRILSKDNNGIKRRIFPNPKEDNEIKELFDVEREIPDVNSLIILPLQYSGEIIGLITLSGSEKNQFNYDDINEVALEQIANQAAASLRYAEKDEVHKRLGEALNALNSSSSLNEILEKLAEQACKLVGGLFSYIVVPDQAQTCLEFRGAWSQDHEKKYIEELNERIFFIDRADSTKIKRGFPIPYEGSTQKRGITGLAFIKRKVQLLENINHKNYEEISKEARDAYYRYEYSYRDERGNLHAIDPSSDVAIPILLELNQDPSSENKKQALGVINVEHQDPFAFTKEHISALEQLAEFAAIAIQNRKKQDFISELYDLSDFPYEEYLPFNNDEENLSFKSIELFLDQVAEKVKKVSKAKYVTVHAIKDNKSFIIGKSNPPQYVNEGSRWGNPKTEGHTFWCVRNKKPVYINDTRKYAASPKDYIDIFGQRYLRENNEPIPINRLTDLNTFQALACIPMLLPNQDPIGVIWMHHEKSPDYTKEEIELLLKFAGRAANTLDIVEKITFREIEKKIGMIPDKDVMLEKIVEMAKYYFGLRGAAIYEADTKNELLERVKSNIKQFYSNEIIHYSEENTQGLAGHVMRGINVGGYPYADGFCHISEYTLEKYAHAMRNYAAERIKELGSVVGIRIPANSAPNHAVGVLIVADEVGRKYDKSKEDLLRFADIAGKCLKTFREGKNAFSIDADERLELQKQIDSLRRKNNEKEELLSVMRSEKDKVEREKVEIKQEQERLESENLAIKNIARWVTFSVLVVCTIYPIWSTSMLEMIISPERIIIGKILVQSMAIAILLLLPLWQNKKTLGGIATGLGLLLTFLQLLDSIWR